MTTLAPYGIRLTRILALALSLSASTLFASPSNFELTTSAAPSKTFFAGHPVSGVYAAKGFLFANVGTMDFSTLLLSWKTYRSIDSGNTWKQVYQAPGEDNLGEICSNDQYLFMQSGHFLLRSADRGTTWNKILNGVNVNTLALAVSGSLVFVSNYPRGILRSKDHGKTWAQATNGLPSWPILGFTVDGDQLYVGTEGGGVYRTSNWGDSWIAANKGLKGNIILGIAATPNALFATSDGKGVFRSFNKGATWQWASQGIPLNSLALNLLAVATSGNSVFAASNGLYRSNDLGATWSLVTNKFGVPASSIVVEGKRIFVSAFDGLLSLPFAP